MLYEHEVRVLCRTSLVSVIDFRCWRVEPKRLLPVEAMSAPVVLFPRRGRFFRHGPERARFADPNDVLFFNAHEPFQISYPGSDGDDSTIFRIDPDVLREILAESNPRLVDSSEARFTMAQQLSGSDLFFAHGELFREALGDSAAGALRIEEGVLQLVARLVAANRASSPPGAARARAATRRAHRDCAENVKAVLAARFCDHLTLGDLSRSAGTSPYHLCRVFNREVGTSLHRYLNRLRLRDSLRRLLDTRTPLSELALDLGYSSHSHFTDAFRREFGVSPTAFRRGAEPLRT